MAISATSAATPSLGAVFSAGLREENAAARQPAAQAAKQGGSVTEFRQAAERNAKKVFEGESLKSIEGLAKTYDEIRSVLEQDPSASEEQIAENERKFRSFAVSEAAKVLDREVESFVASGGKAEEAARATVETYGDFGRKVLEKTNFASALQSSGKLVDTRI